MRWEQWCLHVPETKESPFKMKTKNLQKKWLLHCLLEKLSSKQCKNQAITHEHQSPRRQDRIVDPLYFSVKDANLNYTKDQV